MLASWVVLFRVGLDRIGSGWIAANRLVESSEFVVSVA